MVHSSKGRIRATIHGILPATVACPSLSSAAAPAPQLSASERQMPPIIEKYTADTHSLEATYRISFAPITLARFEKFERDELAKIEAVDFGSLNSQEDRVDYLLLKARVNGELHQLALRQRQAAEMQPLLPFAEVIETLIDEKRRMLRPDGQQSARSLTDIVQRIRAAQKQFEPNRAASEGGAAAPARKHKIDPVVAPVGGSLANRSIANRAVEAAQELQRELHTWYGQYEG
jgi:hypothetical protein